MMTSVVGFRPPDVIWTRHLKVWEACCEAGVPVPDATLEFFNDEDPTGKPGMEVDIPDAATSYNGDGESGFDVDISLLPKGVTVVRFRNSW